MLRLVRRRSLTRGPWRRSNHIADIHCTDGCGKGKARGEAKHPAVSKTATKTRPAAATTTRRTATAVPKSRPNGKALSAYITERFDEFSRSQKDVARYIVDHLDEAAFQTAEELARRADTSSSTVVRFSQALGFEGYPELQQAAIEEYRQPRRRQRPAPAPRRCSTSTTPSSRPRSPPTTPTSRRPSATSPASRSRPASPRSRGAHRVMIVGMDQLAFFASYLRHLLALLDIRAEVVASPRQDSITRLSPRRRGHPRDRLLGRPRASDRRPRDEARQAPRRHDDRDHRRDPLRRRRALRPDALLLVELPLVHPARTRRCWRSSRRSPTASTPATRARSRTGSAPSS